MHDLDHGQIGQSSSVAASRPGYGSALNEEAQTNLAADLMELESEQEFEDFVGDLISQGAAAVGNFVNSPTGQALGSVLKNTAKQLLPAAGQAVGTYLGGSTGGQIGGALGTAASNALEAETDEQEWESANTFVKLAADAANKAAEAPPGADPMAVARTAVVEAAKIHAPHLLAALADGRPEWTETPPRKAHSGRWIRHGRRIIVYGV